jgi:hypothetical protein
MLDWVKQHTENKAIATKSEILIFISLIYIL